MHNAESGWTLPVANRIYLMINFQDWLDDLRFGRPGARVVWSASGYYLLILPPVKNDHYKHLLGLMYGRYVCSQQLFTNTLSSWIKASFDSQLKYLIASKMLSTQAAGAFTFTFTLLTSLWFWWCGVGSQNLIRDTAFVLRSTQYYYCRYRTGVKYVWSLVSCLNVVTRFVSDLRY